MSISKKLMAQGGNPSGFLGKIIGKLMNYNHSNIYQWGLDCLSFTGISTALDIGCGGGKAVKMLAQKMPKGKVFGIDHSREMVQLARSVNDGLIRYGRVEIKQGCVSNLAYSENQFDFITAFETIQFWPDLTKNLQEIKRRLKPAGKILIINRYPDLKGRNAKWAEMLQIHSSTEYHERLSKAGFADILIDDHTKPGWIRILAHKPAL